MRLVPRPLKMKTNKLPSTVVWKIFSSITKILESQIFKVTKYITYFGLAAALVLGILYLNVIKEQVFYLQNKPQTTAIYTSGIILDKTAAIIARDGHLPAAVAKKYSIWIYEAAAKYSLDPILLLSIIYTESRFNYKAVSPTGPIGLFQIASSYHKEKATKAALFDPKINIMVGAQIVREYSNMSSGIIETLLRYNGSLGQGTSYASKVIRTKHKYDAEIMKAVAS